MFIQGISKYIGVGGGGDRETETDRQTRVLAEASSRLTVLRKSQCLADRQTKCQPGKISGFTES